MKDARDIIIAPIISENTMDQMQEANTYTFKVAKNCLLYTSPSPRDRQKSRMPSSA